jgi:hypothetical protein
MIIDNSCQEDTRLSVNLLGLSPFEYPSDKQVDSLYDILENAGFSIAANWGRGTAAHPVNFSDVKAAASADVSLVLSSLGLKAAQFLYEHLGIPYVIGNPLVSDEFASIVFKDLKALEVKNSYLDYLENSSEISLQSDTDNPDNSMSFSGNSATTNPAITAFVGEPVTMGSEAAALKLSSSETSVALICTTELTGSLISTAMSADSPADTTERNYSLILCPRGETEIAEAMKKATLIHGDPLFKNAYSYGTPGFDPSHQTWIDEPHLAMSGRLFADSLLNS